eukprot:16357-Chlamydomonas_euryale.AAC.2
MMGKQGRCIVGQASRQPAPPPLPPQPPLFPTPFPPPLPPATIPPLRHAHPALPLLPPQLPLIPTPSPARNQAAAASRSLGAAAAVLAACAFRSRQRWCFIPAHGTQHVVRCEVFGQAAVHGGPAFDATLAPAVHVPRHEQADGGRGGGRGRGVLRACARHRWGRGGALGL